MRAGSSPTVQLVHFGCAKNQVDAEEILGLLARDGFRVCGPGEQADVVVIHTCGFLQSARTECMEAIREAASRGKRNGGRKLVVAGCLAQRYGDELAAMDGVDAVVGTGRNTAVAEVVRTLAQHAPASERIRVTERPRHEWIDSAPRMLSTLPGSAYLKIAEGCDRPCSFCTIPSIRGPFVSKPVDVVLREARKLAVQGVVELNLVAQDSTNYGCDLPGRPSLTDLVEALHDVEGIRWIRVLYAYPGKEIERLVEAMPSLPKLCHYVDIPLQHSYGPILRAMRRPGDGSAYISMLTRMRERVPDLAVRTTMIVGFPGETDEAFADLLEFVETARFDRLGAFEFSPEPGTPAFDMDGQVPPDKRAQRYHRLMELQQRISLQRNRELVGRDLQVLVESRTAGGVMGRSYRDAPEVDGTVLVRGCHAEPGSMLQVRITDADVYDLQGVVVPPTRSNNVRHRMERTR